MRVIAIDAGHGKNTAGKRCMKSLDPAETREWVLNDRIADRLEKMLKAYDCKVIRTDDTTGKTDVSLAKRVKTANNAGADVFISIHHNAGIHGKSGGGTAVFHLDNETPARQLYNAIIERTDLKGNRANPVSVGRYDVIVNTNMPAFLIENGFMDSAVDVPIILTEKHAKKTARGIRDFLVDYLDLEKLEDVEDLEDDEEDPTFQVRIMVDNLHYRSGPSRDHKINGVVTRNQVYTIEEVSGKWGKLISGAGWINISEKYVTRL